MLNREVTHKELSSFSALGAWQLLVTTPSMEISAVSELSIAGLRDRTLTA